MASAASSAMDKPSARAGLARERIGLLSDNEIVYVDRVGPRILAVPRGRPAPLSRDILRQLSKGNFTEALGRGSRFLSKWMMKCPEISVNANGQYTVQKVKKSPKEQEPPAHTVKTLDIWSGRPGTLHEDRDIEDLVFYSLDADSLPSYHSWKGDTLERRESSLEVETRRVAAVAEESFAKSPQTIAVLIDKHVADQEAKLDRDASSDPHNLLRFTPDILPSNTSWEAVEEYFKWVLAYEREAKPEAPEVLRVLRDELLESQLLLAIPAVNSGYRAKIQDENTERYHTALQTTFLGKPDNLPTKLTMLCFGLPIQPLTLVNVKFAGGLEDVPGDNAGGDEDGGNVQIVERVMWSEKPLEYLDYYNERSHGYPMIRSQKRKYEEVDSAAMEKLLAQAQERAKHPRLLWDGCGFPEMDEVEEVLHLRGGAGSDAGLPARTYWLYSDLGRFIVDVDAGQFFFDQLNRRLFRLGVGERRSCQTELIVVKDTDSGKVADPQASQYWGWSVGDAAKAEYESIYKRWLNWAMKVPDRLILRTRYNAKFKKENPEATRLESRSAWEPENSRSLVNLEVEGVGVAYWFLPSSPDGINMLQDTFRNAIECLIPQHRLHRVQWSIEGAQGQGRASGELQLIAEAPSAELWNETQRALDFHDRVSILFKVIPVEKMQPNTLAVNIFVPGFGQVGWYNRPKEEDISGEVSRILDPIRALVHIRTQPARPPMRVWSGMQNYDDLLDKKTPKYKVLFAKHDPENEIDVWQSLYLALVRDGIVTAPYFEQFRVTSLTAQKSETLETNHGYLTLKQFRDCAAALTENFRPSEDYIHITQTNSNQIFLVGPFMTERQWEVQVFDWLDSGDITFRHVQGWTTTYPRNIMEGPLGPTYHNVDIRAIDSSKPNPGGPKIIGPALGGSKPASKTPKSTGKQPSKTTKSKPAGKQFAGTASTGTVSTGTAPPGTLPLGTLPTSTNTGSSGTAQTPVVTQVATGPAAGAVTQTTGATISGQTIGLGGSKELTEYQKYRAQQAEYEARRVEAYTLNESLHQNGQGPQIPMFGPAVEGNVPTAGSNVPTLYTSLTTPTENAARDRELEALRRLVINRMEFCEVCQTVLPAGNHNQGERDRHYQQHRRLEAEASQNVTGSISNVVQTSVQEVFYCECCGLTPDEDHEQSDHPGPDAHGEHCALTGTIHEGPHYCQYCRLDFWENDMTNETALAHVQNCANHRRISPQGQISLYQQLLSNTVGQEQLNGDSSCYFDGCQEIFNSATTNLARANHFMRHLDRNDEPRRVSGETNTCPFEGCDEDLTSMTEDDMMAHLQLHFSAVDGSRVCGWPSCGHIAPLIATQEGVLEEKREHLRWHFRQTCPWPYCDHIFPGNVTMHDIEQHLIHQHMLDCQWPDCEHRFGASDSKTMIRNHYRIHCRQSPGTVASSGAETNIAECQWPDCDHEFSTDAAADEVIRHFNAHMPLQCPWPNCGHPFALDGPWTEKRDHLRTHFTLQCPIPGCNYRFREMTSEAERTAHVGTHMGVGGPLVIVRQCIWPNCVTQFDENSTQNLIGAHFRTHLGSGATGISAGGNRQCPFPKCHVEFVQNATANAISSHFRTHLGPGASGTSAGGNRQCPFSGCGREFGQQVTLNEMRLHFGTHMPKECSFPGCAYIFPLSATDEEKRMHMHTHCPRDCQWPGCQNVHFDESTDEAIITHLLAHATVYGYEPEHQQPENQGLPASGSIQEPLDQGAPLIQSPVITRPDQPDDDPDNLPDDLKALAPNMDFFCPACFMKVSGGNKSACRRHRKAPCSVLGHTQWLIGSVADRDRWKKEAITANSLTRNKATASVVVADKSYRTEPQTLGNGSGDDSDDGGDDTSSMASAAKSGDKRKHDEGGDGEENQGRTGAKKRSKK